METTFLNKIKVTKSWSDPKIFDQVAFIVDLIQDSESVSNKYLLLQELEKFVKKHSREMGETRKKYQELLTEMSFASFALLPDETLENLFKSHLHKAYNIGFDFKKAISLMFAPRFIQDDFRKQNIILRALEDNSELIGGHSLTLSNAREVSPSISNWVKDYKVSITEDKGTLNRISYITTSNNSKNLNKTELDFLKYVLDFYDWIRFNSSKVDFTELNEIDQKQKSKQAPKIQPLRRTEGIHPAPMHGESIDELKNRLKETTIDIPKSKSNPIQEEIKREVETKELPSHSVGNKKFNLQSRVPNLHGRANLVPRPQMALKSLDDIKVIEDLKKIEVGHLHQGPPEAQVKKIKTKILELARVNNLIPYHTVSVFEQSPLFKQYLFLGGSLVVDNRQDREAAFNEALIKLKASGQKAMSLAEFEAVADLRKEIEQM